MADVVDLLYNLLLSISTISTQPRFDVSSQRNDFQYLQLVVQEIHNKSK